MSPESLVISEDDLPGSSSSGVLSESLTSAVLNGHIEDAQQLIEDGADVNAEDAAR